MLTTVVQNTSEPKIDTKYAGQPKKTDTADPFGDCLRSVESKQDTHNKNEKVGKEKKEKNSIPQNVLPAAAVVVAYIPEGVVLANAAATCEANKTDISLPALNTDTKIEIRDLGITSGGAGRHEASGAIEEGGTGNYPMSSANISEKTVPQKPHPTSETETETETDMPLSVESQAETMNTDNLIPAESMGNSEPLKNTHDTAYKKLMPEQKTEASGEIKPKAAEEALPQQMPQDKSMKSEAEYRVSSNTKLNTNDGESHGEKSAQPLSGEKSKADKTGPLPLEEKTVQSKSGGTNAAEDDKTFSLPQKEAGPKKASGSEMAEAPEFSLASVSIGKKNENSKAISGENVVSQITRAIKENKGHSNTRLTVELSPKELGKISVEMKLSDGKLNLLLNAENKETAEALSEHIGLLKMALTANKVEIQNLDVSRPTHGMSFSNMNDSGGKFSGEDRGVYYENDAVFSVYEDKSESVKPRTYSQHSQLLNYLA